MSERESGAADSLEERLERVVALGRRIEETDDPETVVELLGELDRAAKELLAEIERERRQSGAGA